MATRYTTKPCRTCKAITSALVTRGAEVTHPTMGWVHATDVAGVFIANGEARIPCRSCGAIRVGRRVFGKVSERHACGARCMASKGFDCECSCGGANHGAAYSAC